MQRCFFKPIPSQWRHNDVTMSAMASQITSLTIVYSTDYSGADQRRHQSSASVVFARGIHLWPVNSLHKGPVTRKMLPFDDVIRRYRHNSILICGPRSWTSSMLGRISCRYCDAWQTWNIDNWTSILRNTALTCPFSMLTTVTPNHLLMFDDWRIICNRVMPTGQWRVICISNRVCNTTEIMQTVSPITMPMVRKCVIYTIDTNLMVIN